MEASLIDTRRPIAPEIAYRADIDGLRAVAVLSVIGFHASPKSITGGFIGVDVFFVISGYLISSLILNGLKNGSFSYVEFYARRARRIFPALTVVLLFVWGLGWFAFDPTNFFALSKHIVAGAAFAANIVTYFEVGYFDAPASTKPLLHLWSLGVEEQFYLVFPLLIVLLWRHKAANLILSVIAVASFALNVHDCSLLSVFCVLSPANAVLGISCRYIARIRCNQTSWIWLGCSSGGECSKGQRCVGNRNADDPRRDFHSSRHR